MQSSRDSLILLILLLPIPFMLLYLDREIVSAIRDIKSSNQALKPHLESIYYYTKWAGHGATLVTISIVSLILGVFKNRNFTVAGKLMVLSYVFSGIVVQILKHLLGRARPRVTLESLFIGPSIKSGFDSFPSGHTTSIFCIAYVLSHFFPKYRYLFYSYASFVALERLWHGSHFPSDVLAGVALGITCGMVLVKSLIPKLERKFSLLRIDLPQKR